MITSENILNDAKIILVDNLCSLEKKWELFQQGRIKQALNFNTHKEYKIGIDNWLKDKTYLKIGSNNLDDVYDNDDIHHYKTSYWYNHIVDISNYIGIPFKMDDFFMKNAVFSGVSIDYIVPKMSPLYTVHYARLDPPDENDIVTYYPNAETETGRYENFILQHHQKSIIPGWTAYHSLFKYAHECIIIDNEILLNGKTLIMSCNSHSIPLIMPFSLYYKRMIILDNRFSTGGTFKELYENEVNENGIDYVIMLSYDNNIDKFIKENLE